MAINDNKTNKFVGNFDNAVASSKPVKIMLVEDNSLDYQGFCSVFEENEADITWCKSAEEALPILEKKADYFELMVCDYNLPQMSGLELSRCIIEKKLPFAIVLLIGSGNEKVAIEALKMGVEDYLIKDDQKYYLSTIPIKLSKALEQFNDSLIKKNIEDKLAIATEVFCNTTEAIVITDSENMIQTVNQAFSDITGYSADEVIGKNPKILSSDRQCPEFFQIMWKEIKEKGHWKGEIWNKRKNGDVFPEWLVINCITNSKGEINHYIGIYTDITPLKEAEEKLYKHAYYDALTQLPNRISFLERLQHELARNKRDMQVLALMFIDLDHFKWVNDNLGHQVGDEFLKVAADRLKENIRESDTAARFAGDEFVAIFPNIKSSDDVAGIAEKILLRFAETFNIDNHELKIQASIGIALCSGNEMDVGTLIKNADTAMYRSKKTGRHTFHFFTEEMQTAIEQRNKRVSELKTAIEQRQMNIVYQPFIDIKSDQVVGAEALARWQHPILGEQVPADFIPLAEQTKLIAPLGNLIIELVCKQAKQWQDAGFRTPEISVNLSKLQLQQLDFLVELKEIVKRTGVDTLSLTLEIKESLMVDEQNKIIPLLLAIKKLGFKLAIDDFGTGYSSLSEIKFFPLDLLKIPRPFLKNITNDIHNSVLAETIIKMGHSLNLKIVAEGIETEQQLQFLKQRKCDIGQGFLFSKGIQADEMTLLLEQSKSY